jgi:hypothetical protein
MAHERTMPPWNQPSAIPAGYEWPTLLSKEGDALEVQYRHTLEALGKAPGMLAEQHHRFASQGNCEAGIFRTGSPEIS